MALKIVGTYEKPISWSEFEENVHDDIEETRVQRTTSKLPHSNWVYRGQACSEWGLLTSLERYWSVELGHQSKTITAKEYYRYLDAVIPAVNSLLGQRFERFDPSGISFEQVGKVPHYELLCFCRHLGFPSPLLDWSSSYYVAAFFAFRHAKPRQPVAIYANKQWDGKAISFWDAEPVIQELGPYVETHERHFKQQSVYTVCSSILNAEPVFASHEDAVAINPRNNKIRKFILDSNEREAVLKKLYAMNINDYTLFGDEESLLRMLAFKVFNKL